MQKKARKILEDREKRWLYRCKMVEKFNLPVVTVTMNIPGTEKNDPLFILAHKAILKDYLLAAKQIHTVRPCYIEYRLSNDGPEAFIVYNGEAISIKRQGVEFEERHPVGRLVDVDVMDINKKTISRRELSISPRLCLICGEPVRHCTALNRHTLEQVLEVVRSMLEDYLKPPLSSKYIGAT